MVYFPFIIGVFYATYPVRSMLMQMKTSTTWDLSSWQAGYESCRGEACTVLEGSVPNDLEGTYFRNGYGKFDVGLETVLHPFDGDGLVNALQIKDGKVSFRNRFVGTSGFKKERKYRKIMFRGAFGTQRKGGMLSNIFDINVKNVANTNVIYWGGRLLALWEGGLPHRMESDSLRTLGEYTFRGLLKKKGVGFSAHPRVDSVSGNLVNFAVERTTSASVVTVYEFDDDLHPQKEFTFNIPGFVFMHDFVVTQNYYIFNQAPTKFNPFSFLIGLQGPASCISFDKLSPAIVWLVPRNGSGDICTVEVDNHFNFHFANAYENASNGDIVFDVVWTDSMELGNLDGKTETPIWKTVDYAKDVPMSTLQRYTLSKNDNTNWSYQRTPLSSTGLDFTSVAPSVSCTQHRYVYASCGSDLEKPSPPQGIIKVDTEYKKEQIWIGEEFEWLGESIFAPRKGGGDEDDGYLLSYLFNGKTKQSQFVMFDAKNINEGPICRLDLPTNIPHGLHGSWVPDLTFNEDDIERRWRASRAIDNKGWNEVDGKFSGLGISAALNDN